MNPIFDDPVSDNFPITEKELPFTPIPDKSLNEKQKKQFHALVYYVTEREPLRENHMHCIYYMIELIAMLEYFQESYETAKKNGEKLDKAVEENMKLCIKVYKADLKEQYGLFVLNNFRLKKLGLPLVSSFEI